MYTHTHTHSLTLTLVANILSDTCSLLLFIHGVHMVYTLILFLYTLLCVHVAVLACSIVNKVYTVCVCVCVSVLLHEQHVCY